MSILIKGMELPKQYGPHEITITLFVRDDGTASLWGKEVFIPHEPLEVIPIPPHGRLIDADDFIKRMEGLVHRAEADGYDLGASWYAAFIRHIELAPTVIPAEEK